MHDYTRVVPGKWESSLKTTGMEALPLVCDSQEEQQLKILSGIGPGKS
jgi:hypothetical protein